MLAAVERIRNEWQTWYDNGKEEGKIEGKIEGKKQNLREIAYKMLAENFSKDTIMKITGLKKEEIDKIKQEK